MQMNRITNYFSKFQPLKPYLYPYRWTLLFVTGILFFQIWFTVLVPVPAKRLLNDVLPSKPGATLDLKVSGLNFGVVNMSEALWILALLSVAVGVLLMIASWLEQYFITESVFRIQRQLRYDLYDKLFTRRQAYLDSRRKVDLVGRVSGDVQNMEIFLTQGFTALARDVPMISTLVVMMAMTSMRLTVVFVCVLLAYYFVMNFFTVRNRLAARLLRRSVISYEEDGYEALSSMAIAKGLRGEKKLFERLVTRIEGIIGNERSVRNNAVTLECSIGVLGFATKGVMYLFGGWEIFRGEVQLGDVFQIVAYMQIIEKYINSINKFVTKYPKAAASLERLTQLTAELALNPESSGSLAVTPGVSRTARHVVEFVDVNFHYEENRPLLSKLNLTLPPGQLVAVAGTSGAGKSSFGRLLNRLQDPVNGKILLSGINLHDLQLDSLRATVRMLSQETFLISATVRENLLLGTEEKSSDDELWNALKLVHGDTFVRALPNGLDTPIGEGGHQLSGGQAKKIHVARAFLDKRSEILLVDEPTSGLDAQSAEIVLNSVKELATRKSLVLWVTHHAQEIAKADAVLFFSANQNPIFSTHEELYAENPAYRALLQAGESSSPREQDLEAKKKKELLKIT